MRLTERELTLALTGAAQSVLAAQDRSVRKGRRSVEAAWQDLGGFRRFQLLDGLGDQLLPVLVALPDVEVAIGQRPRATDEQVRAVVEEQLGDLHAGGVRRRVLVRARIALVQTALASIPPRQDPDALIVPDHL